VGERFSAEISKKNNDKIKMPRAAKWRTTTIPIARRTHHRQEQ
jgi:hypothetical protein